jgi:hypothetical protein
MREPSSVAEIGLFLEQAVGHNLIPDGRGDNELARSFVIRMIDHRQPLASIVWPVLAKETSLAKLVIENPQAFRRTPRYFT